MSACHSQPGPIRNSKPNRSRFACFLGNGLRLSSECTTCGLPVIRPHGLCLRCAVSNTEGVLFGGNGFRDFIYHGSMDGYPEIQALARANVLPPPEYNPSRSNCFQVTTPAFARNGTVRELFGCNALFRRLGGYTPFGVAILPANQTEVPLDTGLSLNSSPICPFGQVKFTSWHRISFPDKT
jgi:hypothetical protein